MKDKCQSWLFHSTAKDLRTYNCLRSEATARLWNTDLQNTDLPASVICVRPPRLRQVKPCISWRYCMPKSVTSLPFPSNESLVSGMPTRCRRPLFVSPLQSAKFRSVSGRPFKAANPASPRLLHRLRSMHFSCRFLSILTPAAVTFWHLRKLKSVPGIINLPTLSPTYNPRQCMGQ